MWGIQNRSGDYGLFLGLLDRELGGSLEFPLFLSGACFSGRCQERFPAVLGASPTGVAFRILSLRGALAAASCPVAATRNTLGRLPLEP